MKYEIKECLEDFLKAKEEQDIAGKINAAKRLFSYDYVTRFIRHGAPNRSYGFYGAERLAFIYKNINREQWYQIITERVEKKFVEEFDVDINNIDSEATARKMLTTFMAMYTRHEVMEYAVLLAKRKYPHVSTHYICKYIKMRKQGMEIDNYDWRQVESIKRMMLDTGYSMSTCYNLFYVFGTDVTKEDVTKARRNAIDANFGIKNHDCKNSSRAKAKKIKKKGLDITIYNVHDIESMKQMSEDTGYKISTCVDLLTDIGLVETQRPKKIEMTIFNFEDFED